MSRNDGKLSWSQWQALRESATPPAASITMQKTWPFFFTTPDSPSSNESDLAAMIPKVIRPDWDPIEPAQHLRTVNESNSRAQSHQQDQLQLAFDAAVTGRLSDSRSQMLMATTPDVRIKSHVESQNPSDGVKKRDDRRTEDSQSHDQPPAESDSSAQPGRAFSTRWQPPNVTSVDDSESENTELGRAPILSARTAIEHQSEVDRNSHARDHRQQDRSLSIAGKGKEVQGHATTSTCRETDRGRLRAEPSHGDEAAMTLPQVLTDDEIKNVRGVTAYFPVPGVGWVRGFLPVSTLVPMQTMSASPRETQPEHNPNVELGTRAPMAHYPPFDPLRLPSSNGKHNDSHWNDDNQDPNTVYKFIPQPRPSRNANRPTGGATTPFWNAPQRQSTRNRVSSGVSTTCAVSYCRGCLHCDRNEHTWEKPGMWNNNKTINPHTAPNSYIHNPRHDPVSWAANNNADTMPVTFSQHQGGATGWTSREQHVRKPRTSYELTDWADVPLRSQNDRTSKKQPGRAAWGIGQDNDNNNNDNHKYHDRNGGSRLRNDNRNSYGRGGVNTWGCADQGVYSGNGDSWTTVVPGEMSRKDDSAKDGASFGYESVARDHPRREPPSRMTSGWPMPGSWY